MEITITVIQLAFLMGGTFMFGFGTCAFLFGMARKRGQRRAMRKALRRLDR